MTNLEFVNRLKHGLTVKTLYVKGGIGYPLDGTGKQLSRMYSFNRTGDRLRKIQAADKNTFAFDCVCFVKAVLWGWTGNPNRRFGGATYMGSPTPDVTYDVLYNEYCREHSDNFANIKPGELLIMDGHCGVYAGNGEVIEAGLNPEGDGVMLTKLNRRKDGSTWKHHAKIKEIAYVDKEEDSDKIRIEIPEKYRGRVEVVYR